MGTSSISYVNDVHDTYAATATTPPLAPPPLASMPTTAVLTNRPLWRYITDFQTGYPFVVRHVVASGDIPAFVRRTRGWEMYTLFGDDLKRRGIVTHLAIISCDVRAFQQIYALAKRPQYQHDDHLDQSRAIRCAILYNRIEVLNCLAVLRAQQDTRDPIAEPNLLALAMRLDDSVDIAVLDWIEAHAPHEVAQLTKAHLCRCAASGRINVVRWLCARRSKLLSRRALHSAAVAGHADVLAFLYTQTYDRCKATAVNIAAMRGHVDVVQLIVTHQRRATALQAINFAAESGATDVVAFLINSGAQLDTRRVLDFAASSGDVQHVQFVYEHYPQAFTGRALVNATKSGSIAVVTFLFETLASIRSDDATVNAAMRCAIEYDKLDVVRYLHTHCARVECPPSAFDAAARSGHLAIVQFLYTHRTEGCTSNALNYAARNGHLEVVRFLCEHYSDANDVEVALKRAAMGSWLKIVQYLLPRLTPGQSAFPALAAAARNTLSRHSTPWCENIVEYLLDHERLDERMSLREQAVTAQRATVLYFTARRERRAALVG